MHRISHYSKSISRSCVWAAAAALVFSTTYDCQASEIPPSSGVGWTLTQTPGGGYQLEDTVDWAPNNTGWSYITSGSFPSSYGGLTPKSGTYFFEGLVPADKSSANRGLSRYFEGVKIQPGTYTVTFNMGDYNTSNVPDNFAIQLMADTDQDGEYSYNERIPTTSTTGANIAPDEDWKQWTYTYSIDKDTLNKDGKSIVGNTLGFMMLSKPASGAGYAFDNFRLEYTPAAQVPESSVLWLAAAPLLFTTRWIARHATAY